MSERVCLVSVKMGVCVGEEKRPCVCVCVRVGERERERDKRVCVCVCVCFPQVKCWFLTVGRMFYGPI